MSKRSGSGRATPSTAAAQPRADGHPRLIVDSWVDDVRGFGDPTRAPTYQSRPELRYAELAPLYEQNWLAQRIVQDLPEDALRRRPGGPTPELWAKYDELNRHEAYEHGVLMQGLCQGRAFGGALILLGFAYGKPTEPAPETGAKSGLAWLDAVPWEDLQVTAYESDPNSPRYRLPLRFRVTGDHPRMGLEIHVSRTILCGGAPRAKQARQNNITPWLSVLQAVYDEIQAYGLNWASVDALLGEASIGVLSMGGFAALASRKNRDALQARLQALSMGKSSARTLFLDADQKETFTRTDVTFTGVSQIVDQLLMRIAGAAHEPLTRLFGRSPAGMNATGESDLSQWYDRCEAYREQSIAPKVQRLFDLIAGKRVELEWPSLWQASAQEQAATRAALFAADKVLVDMGAVDPLSVLESRSKDKTLGLDVDVTAERRLAEQTAEEERKAREAGLAAAQAAQEPKPPADEPEGVAVEGE